MQSRTAALVAGSMASFLVPFMMSAVGITLPVVQTELQATAVELSWVAGSYILALAAILLPVGRLADIWGRRRTFVWGTAAFVVFSVCASLAWSVASLVALRIVQGVGAAMILTTGVAIVTDIYPKNERGKVMGVLVACVYLGLSVGPLVGGLMTDLAGWRSVFFLSLPPGLACWLLALRIDGEWRPAAGERFDALGSFYYALFVVCFVNGLTGLARPAQGIPLLAGAVAGDRALVVIADILKELCADQNCFLARLGGDEFVILGMNRENFSPERMTGGLDDAVATFNAHTTEPFRLSLSIGWARFDPARMSNADALLIAADQAMYRVKASKLVRANAASGTGRSSHGRTGEPEQEE